MKNGISPEERLLRLIKNSKKPQTGDTGLKNIDNSVMVGQAVAQPKVHSFLYPDWPQVSMIAVVLMVLSFLYFVFMLIYPYAIERNVEGKNSGLKNKALQAVRPFSLGAATQAKPYEFYAQGLGKRRIFSASGVSAAGVSSVPQGAEADVIKNINLVGIISGDNPQAIIEDKKLNKTYYLNKGQLIGEVKIEDIQEGKAILNYKGQLYEMYL